MAEAPETYRHRWVLCKGKYECNWVHPLQPKLFWRTGSNEYRACRICLQQLISHNGHFTRHTSSSSQQQPFPKSIVGWTFTSSLFHTHEQQSLFLSAACTKYTNSRQLYCWSYWKYIINGLFKKWAALILNGSPRALTTIKYLQKRSSSQGETYSYLPRHR